MTPQAGFMVVAPLTRGRESAVRELLAGMNFEPGRCNPLNSLVPFGRLERLHFARIVVLDDQTLDDISAYGRPREDYPLSVAFLGDFDGDYDSFLKELVAMAGSGLRQIFANCSGFSPGCDLLDWLKSHEQRPATYYANWRGRTVRQCREEAALRRALVDHLQQNPEVASLAAPELRVRLREFVRAEQAADRLTLTPEAPTPFGWRLRNTLHAIFAVPVLAVELLAWGVAALFLLRAREKSDPVIAPRPDPELAARLFALEDHEIKNQFSAIGSLKPGIFRRWTLTVLLAAIDYTARHVYVRGRLARVHTIHFARWVFLDGKKRLFFASNYDGSLESYMDDFINKVAFGLNVVFTNGIGYPRTRWLFLDGAKDEQTFKYYIRRHELATEVWYDGHAGLTALDMQRNTVVRKGMETGPMTNQEADEWAALL
ncbi:MAG: hypothetical protein IT161_20645 [Bryobacterales bacterium]|nr:hypothetical protein [Bryobacterales bacterium]